MRDLLVFASLISLCLVIRGALRLPDSILPGGLLVYLGAQVFFTFCCWIASQRLAYSADGYAKVYYSAAIPMVIALAVLTLRTLAHSSCWTLITVAVIITLGLFDTVRRESPGLDFLELQASLFVACGVCLLASLVHVEDGLSNRLRAALGILWLVQGLFHYAYAGSIVRFRAAAITHAAWVPAFTALVAWTWIAIYLAGLHSELVKQNDTGNELLEVRWLSWTAQELYRTALHFVQRWPS